MSSQVRFSVLRAAAQIARASTTGAAVQSDSNTNPADVCDQGLDTRIEWPITKIEQSTQLNDTQKVTLGKLRTALSESVKNLKAHCRDVNPLQPLDRITATLQELWALRDAGIYVRAPLKDFYDSLTEAQKAAFAWKQPSEEPGKGAEAANSSMARQYQACASPSLESADRMMKQVEQQVRPYSEEQATSVQALRKTSASMAKLLTATCGQPVPTDPVARLDAANDHLSALSYAATSLKIAFDAFYAQLDDQQKARFNSIGG